MAVTFGSIKHQETRRKLKPLNWLEQFLFPFMLLFTTGEQKLFIAKRMKLTQIIRERKRAKAKLKAELAEEADRYEQLLVECWTRLGQRSIYTNDGSIRRDRVKRVRFERAHTSPEIIYFKILVREQGWFGHYNALPYRVAVADLISPETLKELEYACDRVVSVSNNNPRYGVWVRVHRLEGVGGIPGNVTFADMIEHYPEDMSKAPFVVGVGEHRKVHTLTFEDAPHGLIGGATKSGKSNILNFILTNFIRFMPASDLQLTLIDLKRMEFNHYRKAPHLARPVVIEPEQAIEVLQEAINEVLRRADLLASRDCKNFAEWNELYPDEKLPRHLIIVDEFAELMMASGPKVAKATEYLVSRVTNLGRAVGVHTIICTQRPSKQVVPMPVKANMSFIIAGRTGDRYSSGVIIGTGEAASLPLLPGRMLYLVGSEKHEIQTPYISNEDIKESIAIARGREEGVIIFANNTASLNHPGLLLWICKNHNGVLAVNALADALREYGVPSKDLRAYISDLRTQTRIESPDGRIYEVRKKGGIYHLVIIQDIEDVSSEEIIIEHPPVQPILYLPAPAQPKFDPVEKFVRECCNVVEGKKVKATPLYLKYKSWCETMHYKPVSQQKFGMALKEMGLDSKRGTGGSYWWLGITHSELEEVK